MTLRTLICLFAAVVAAGPAVAQTCTREEFAAAVDRAGANLRRITGESAPVLDARMRKLKDQRGWSEAEYEEKAYTLLDGKRIAAFDAQMGDLIQRIDTLGTPPSNAAPDCSKVPELEAAGIELQATVKARTAFMIQRLDAVIGEGSAAATKPALAPPVPAAKAPVVAAAPPVPKPPAAAPPAPWPTKTVPQAAPPAASQPFPPYSPPPPQPPVQSQDDDGYAIDEIVAASEGVFGKVSANVGSVIEYAFRKSGRPSGYILGTEGGGALVAGLRYGQGTLYMRRGGTDSIRVHWHGPSIGFDIGAAGSKVMFLIYKLDEPEAIFGAFTGIDGSAYVVGGLGLTLITNGQVQMAPIRSGIGLRVGASIGYLRFTRKATWNPF